MDISEHLQKATIPWLKYICEDKGIKLNGTTKPQVTQVLLTYIGDDKEKEDSIREMVDHLVRTKGNKVKESKEAKQRNGQIVQVEVHGTESRVANSGQVKDTVGTESSSANSGVVKDTLGTESRSVNSGVVKGTLGAESRSASSGVVKDTLGTESSSANSEEVTDTLGTKEVKQDNGSQSQQDLFDQSYIEESSSVSEPSDTGTIVEHDMRPQSTSSLRESRGGSLSVSESHNDTTRDADVADDIVNRALTGKDPNESVFTDGYMDESNLGFGEKARSKQVRFSENERDESNGKLELIITLMVEMRRHFDVELACMKEEMESDRESNRDTIKALDENLVALTCMKEEMESERESNRDTIKVLEENHVALTEVNDKAMHQIKVLIEGKDRAMEVTQKQASKAMETVQELNKERIAQGKEKQVHTNKMKQAREKNAGASKGMAKATVNKDQAVKMAKNGSRDIVLVVGDANIEPLVSNRLHETKEVRKLKRSTIKEAEENVAACSKPENVTDIVVHLGSDDMRKGMTAREVKEGIRRIQSKYKGCFKKARFHISALPPTNDKQEINFHLRELAAENKSNFISLKEMKDRQTRQPVAGKIQGNGWTLTHEGTSILAGGIKRSLFSKANIPNEVGRLDRSKLTQTVAAILSQE